MPIKFNGNEGGTISDAIANPEDVSNGYIYGFDCYKLEIVLFL